MRPGHLGGYCAGGRAAICTPLDECHPAGRCDPLSGSCANPDNPDACHPGGTECSASSQCTSGICGGNGICCSAPCQGERVPGTGARVT